MKTSSKKNINIEIERYQQNNYAISEIILFLKNDGFNEDEIKSNLKLYHKKDNDISNSFANYILTIFSLSLFIIFSVSSIFTQQKIINKLIFFIISIVLILNIYNYYKNKIISKLITSIVLVISIIYFLIKIYYEFNNNFELDLRYIVVDLIIVIIQLFLIKNNLKNYMKSKLHHS
jgi:hypothetical protein